MDTAELMFITEKKTIGLYDMQPVLSLSYRLLDYRKNDIKITGRIQELKKRVRYEGYSKINLRLVGKNKRVVIASKRTLSSNKELLFLLYVCPHTF